MSAVGRAVGSGRLHRRGRRWRLAAGATAAATVSAGAGEGAVFLSQRNGP